MENENFVQNPKEIQNVDLPMPPVITDGRTFPRKTVNDDKTTGIGTSIAANSITQTMMTANSIGQSQWKYEQKTVTVTAGGTTGTATVVSGDIVVGYYPSTNQDQFVKSIAISSTTLTITLLANATANNVFVVTLLKT